MAKQVTTMAYSYGELSADAQHRVFLECMDVCARGELYRNDLKEIQTALDFYDGIGGARLVYDSRADDSAWFESVDFYEAIDDAGGVDDYSGCGLWCGWDLAQAFNKHAQALVTLREAVERLETEEQDERDKDGQSYKCYDVMAAQYAYCREFDAALSDVANAYCKIVDDVFDYYYYGNGVSEYWDDCYWVYVEDRWYDADGNDITDLVTRYA